MTATLKGTEILFVNPLDLAGKPAATLQQIQTQDIANLAAFAATSLVITALNTVGAGTITAAGIVNKVTARGGAQSSTPFTDTTDTAANIIAALPAGEAVGAAFKYIYQNNTNANATLTGGTGVTVSGGTVVPAYSWAEFVVTYSAANTITMVGVESGANFETVPIVNTAISTVGAGTLTAAGLVGQVITRSGSVAAYTDTTDTAANIIAALPNAQIGESFLVEIKNTVAFPETLTGGTGVTVSGISVIPGGATGIFLVTYTAAATVTMVGIGLSSISGLPAAQFSTAADSGTFAAGALTGANWVNHTNSGNAPGTVATRTAAQMFTDTPNAYVGQTFMVRIRHNGTGTLTVGAGSNVTLTGTATIATLTSRDYMVTFNSTTTLTMQDMGSGAA